jgi:hypothetical protein
MGEPETRNVKAVVGVAPADNEGNSKHGSSTVKPCASGFATIRHSSGAAVGLHSVVPVVGLMTQVGPRPQGYQ